MRQLCVCVSSDAVAFMIILHCCRAAQYQRHCHPSVRVFYKFQFHQVIKHMQRKKWGRERERENWIEMSILRLTFSEMEMGTFLKNVSEH